MSSPIHKSNENLSSWLQLKTKLVLVDIKCQPTVLSTFVVPSSGVSINERSHRWLDCRSYWPFQRKRRLLRGGHQSPGISNEISQNNSSIIKSWMVSLVMEKLSIQFHNRGSHFIYDFVVYVRTLQRKTSISLNFSLLPLWILLRETQSQEGLLDYFPGIMKRIQYVQGIVWHDLLRF